MNESQFLKLLSAELCALASLLFGGMDGLLTALLIFMVLDYITGLIAAKKHLNSETGFAGITKKGIMLMIVAVGNIFDTLILNSDTSVFRSAVIGFYLANEGLSIIENTARLGVPYPEKLKKALQQLKSDNNDGEMK